MAELRNPYIFGGVKVLINVSTKKYPIRFRWELRRMGIKWYHFPMEEIPDMGVDSLLKAVKVLEDSDRSGEKVILHCMCGNNRSRTVAEAYHFRKYGTHQDDEYRNEPNHLLYNCRAGNLPDESTTANLLLQELRG